MKAPLVSLTLGVALAAAQMALACGACVEDKVAATYDHAVIHIARDGVLVEPK